MAQTASPGFIANFDPRLGPPIRIFNRGRQWSIGWGSTVLGGLFVLAAGLIGAGAFVADPHHSVGDAVQALWLPVGVLMLWVAARMRPVPLVVGRHGFANGAPGSVSAAVFWSDVARFEVEPSRFGAATPGTLRAVLADPEDFLEERRDLRGRPGVSRLQQVSIALGQFQAPGDEIVRSMTQAWQARQSREAPAGESSEETAG